MQKMKITVGGESFDEIRKNNWYYVDKTELIYKLVNDTSNKVTLFTRPRRFGKTLNMSMIESFFDITRDSKGIFDGLAISEHTEFCREWMNQYPVLFISLKDVDGLTFESAYSRLSYIIYHLCVKLRPVISKSVVEDSDLSIFNRFLAQTATESDIQNALFVLMRIMYTIYNKPVVLLIDEYDVPLAKANDNGYYRQMLDVIRGIMSISIKTNEYLKFAVITGCLRIAKESIFTGANNFMSYSVLDERFSEYFGFTQSEIDCMLETAGLSEKAATIKSWYDGYIFGATEVYCPWDVVSYVSALLDNPGISPQNYWKNTSGNRIIRTFVGDEDFDVSAKFETLMNGGAIEQSISDQITYDTLHDSEDNFWSVLLMTGYLTKADTKSAGNPVLLRIPNQEIASIFEDTVVVYFRETLDKTTQRDLLNALWSGDEEDASKALSDLLWHTISYHNYHEDYYHAFLAGTFVGLGYAVESDREHGLGRADIVLKDRRNRRALIIEAKKAASENTMPTSCQEALEQIGSRRYAKDLNGYTTVLCYGIAFFEKMALVKKL